MLAGCLLLLLSLLVPEHVRASGPRYVAGVNYFNPAAKGLPLVWANGKITFVIDQGRLSATQAQSQANTMINAAARFWNSVPTAALLIVGVGQLAEDVSGANVIANAPAGTGATLPADVQPSAITTPVAIILDVDGSVVNAIYGQGSSDATRCPQTGVYTLVDGFSAAGNIVHARIILNGLCAVTTAQLTLMQYQLIRAFGQVAGLDWSQVNDSMFVDETITTGGLIGWPIMHPFERLCTGLNYSCMPNETTLRTDDIAGINRLYPVTSSNIAAFTGKTLTALNTISVQGTISFKRGQGMQGVNVVLTPLTGGQPDVRYTTATVSGALFHSNAGTPVSGPIDAGGNPYNRFGTDDATYEGFFDLSDVPLPAGTTVSDYQLTFEPVDPLYVNGASVGPYSASQVAPSGTMPTLTLSQLSAGATVTETILIDDSADETHTDDGTGSAPDSVTGTGEWLGRLSGYGHTGWYQFAVKANRKFTIEATALDEAGLGTTGKAGIALGLWNGTDALGTTPDLATLVPLNGAETGLSVLRAQAAGTGLVRIAFADVRGDGRPDYEYRGRVLYADSVTPARITPAGGPITIFGTGFRPNATVTIGTKAAVVTSVSPTEITAIAPASNGASGVVTLTVADPQTLGEAVILDELSYDANGTDQIGLVSGPSGTVSQGVPVPLTVRVLAADDLTPAANVTVIFSIAKGAAQLGCGSATCSVVTNASGLATLAVSASSTALTEVAATLSSGASIADEFAGGPAPVVSALNPALYLVAGAQVAWTPQALVLNNGVPLAGAPVFWSTNGAMAAVQAASTMTSSSGAASVTVTAGPLAAEATATVFACQSQRGLNCANFTIFGVHGETAVLLAVSGAGQSLAASATPAPVVLAVTDAVGHPLAGAVVIFSQTLRAWAPACPPIGRCAAAQVLAQQTVDASSDADGSVSLVPLTAPGVASVLSVNASTGEQSALTFQIAMHP